MVDDATFELVFGIQTIAVAASMGAYLGAQYLDIRLFHYWKRRTAGRHLWLRNNASTFNSQLVDTILVNSLLARARRGGDHAGAAAGAGGERGRLQVDRRRRGHPAGVRGWSGSSATASASGRPRTPRRARERVRLSRSPRSPHHPARRAAGT